ncbi:MAG: cheB [Chitinophagaceae bacterium]|nr:cheB [Chitinophagaceae bacterium]
MNAANTYEAIVIGTSAGGLIALASILKGIPHNYPLPIIVVQHRAKDPKDLLEEVLQSKCVIPIRQANEKESIQKGTVYIAPPDYHLLIENDRTFSLSSDELIQYSRPSIDVLFESAAAVYRNKLVGIILTGANHDGASGLALIKKLGGFTIVQDPLEATFPIMPEAAIQSTQTTHIWNLSAIQHFILHIHSDQ